MLRSEEIGQAYQFGNESTVKNILEPNWWESDAQMHDNQLVADEVLRRDEERRRRRDEGEEVEEMGDQAGEPAVQASQKNGDVKPKIVARTRVRPFRLIVYQVADRDSYDSQILKSLRCGLLAWSLVSP